MGALVANHEKRQPPDARAALPYRRSEFVTSLRVAVISTLTLFRWWRDENWSAIESALLTVGQH
jgi:hypothetical protein